jgi:hypothetical protein
MKEMNQSGGGGGMLEQHADMYNLVVNANSLATWFILKY